MCDLPGWLTCWRPRPLAATSGCTLCCALHCIRFLYMECPGRNRRNQLLWQCWWDLQTWLFWFRGSHSSHIYGWHDAGWHYLGKCRTFENKGVKTCDTRSMPNPSGMVYNFWRVMLNKPLDWITPCFQSLRTESSMLYKPLRCRSARPCVKISKVPNVAIYRARIGWNATCSRLWTSSIASNTLRFHSVWISRWCLQCRGTLAPTNRIFGMTAPRTWEFFCNVHSVNSLSNATRLMSQRPQREKLPASPDPLRCDDHVIKRVVWQFCNPQHTSSILKAVTVAQQNYHAIWECCCNPLDEG